MNSHSLLASRLHSRHLYLTDPVAVSTDRLSHVADQVFLSESKLYIYVTMPAQHFSLVPVMCDHVETMR